MKRNYLSEETAYIIINWESAVRNLLGCEIFESGITIGEVADFVDRVAKAYGKTLREEE